MPPPPGRPSLQHVRALLAAAPSRTAALRIAYRHLLRDGLRCIRYAQPARHVLRDTVRRAFRQRGGPTPHDGFDPDRVVNTLRFLRRAGEYVGTEHHVVKNLLHVRYWQQPLRRSDSYKMFSKDGAGVAAQMKRAAYEPFERTLHQLNESLGLCLR
ncbi:hypothetical protein KEM52_002108 [Ascosphaera acerosa]|nr:hypothetical protein KEM52_002108 [Ascosphaera acerosa]